MGLFDTARQVTLARVAGRKASDVTWDGDRGWTLVRGKDGDDLPRDFNSMVMEGWRRNPVVRRCVQENQTSVSEAPIRAYRQDGDGNFERIVGHRAEELFVRANPRDDGVRFIERSVQHFLMGGNTYMEKRRLGSGIPFELYLHRPDHVVGADTDARGVPTAFEVVDDPRRGMVRKVSARDMVHIPDVDPLNEVFGMPRLMSALLETSTDNEATNYVNEVLHNFGSPGTVVSIDADKVRNAKYLERAEDAWTEKFGPGRGRGKVAFLPGAQKVQQVGFNLHELEFLSLRNVTRESICAVFGIDPMMIGLGSASRGGTLSGAEYKEARRAFWEQTILPMMRRYSAVLNAFLAPDFGENVWFMFDLSEVGALQPDRSAEVERAVKMAETGSFTREEIRVETGADPDVEDGAVMVVKGTVKFIHAGEEVPEPEDEEEIAPDDEEDTPDSDDDAEEDDEEDDEEAGVVVRELSDWFANAGKAERSGGRPFTVTGHVVPVRGDRASMAKVWKQFDAFTRSQETVYRLAAEAIYRDQASELRRLALVTLEDEDSAASAAGPAETKGITPDSLDEFRRKLGERFNRYHHEWRRRFDDLLSQTVDVVAGRLSGATGIAFNVHNPLVRVAVNERLNLIVGADENTFRAVMGVVQDGFVDGLSRNQMADRIAGVVTNGVTVRLPSGSVRILSAAERAKLIATTETTAVSNAAAVALMRTTEIPWVKMWLTQGDDRVRPEHTEEEADSEANPVPLDEAFRVTGLPEPSEPNCRCTLLFEQP